MASPYGLLMIEDNVHTRWGDQASLDHAGEDAGRRIGPQPCPRSLFI